MKTIKVEDPKLIKFLDAIKEEESSARAGMDHHASIVKHCNRRIFKLLKNEYSDVKEDIVRYNHETKEITLLPEGFGDEFKKFKELKESIEDDA